MKLVRSVGYCILAISAIYFLMAVWTHADSLQSIAWNSITAVALATGTLLYLVQYLSGGLAWYLWLHAVRERPQPAMVVALFAQSQFAKYVPGSIAQHIARIALGRRHGLDTAAMVVTIALETSWALVAGVAMAGAALAFVGPSLVGLALPSPLRIALIVIIALLLPMIGIWLVGENRPRFMDRWLGARRIAHPDFGTLLACFLLYCANFAISGWIVDLLARYVFGAPESHPLLSIGVFSVAWVVAFVTLVSPGGIGVREAVLLAGLTPAYGPGTALGVAVAYRIVTSIGDGVGFLLGFAAEKYFGRRA